MKDFSYNPPNTRERVAARRRQAPPTTQSGGTPGPRRALLGWLASGRAVSLALLLAALAGLGYIGISGRFVVADVQVSGAGVLKPEAVVALTAAEGQSIWLINPAKIVARLKQDPYIAQASVEAQLPDRLAITVVERRPEVRWQLGGTRFLVDADGLVLGADASLPVSNTLVIEDRSLDRLLKPGDKVEPQVIRLAQSLALRLPTELQLTPQTISWDKENGLFVITSDQRTIIFGRDERLDEKLAVLGMLLGDQTAFSLLDLRPRTPYYREAAAPQP